jgi:hypothetical protein
MSVISTKTVNQDLERPSRTWVHKAGIAISVLVTAFLAFDAAGKLAAAPQVKEGTQALGFPSGQALIMGIVLAICVVVYVIPRTAVLGRLASPRIWGAQSRPTCAWRLRCSRTRCSRCTSAC